MAGNKILKLKDIPTIEDLRIRFSDRERLLSAKVADPSEVLRTRKAMAYAFVYGNREKLELRDSRLVRDVFDDVAVAGTSALLGSTLFHMYLTRKHVFDVSRGARIALRTAIFGIPLVFALDYTLKSYTRVSMYLTDKYLERSEKFYETRDPKVLNPFLEQDQYEN